MRWRMTVSAAAVTMLAASAALVAGAHPAVAANAAGSAPATSAVTAAEPIYAFNTGLVLTVSAKPARGAGVRVSGNSGTAGQRWVVGSHETLRPAANQNLCLNVPGAKYARGAKLQLWTCDSNASEQFSAAAPSGSTQVFYLRPAAKTGYCLTSLTAPPYESGALIGLESCKAQTTQAWSHANLDGIAGFFSDAFIIQAQSPTTAGSAVTAASTNTNQVDQYWISTYTGVSEASPVQLHPAEDTALCASFPAAQGNGAPLRLADCDSASADQQFSGVVVGPGTTTAWWAYLTTADSAYCVQAAASGSGSARPIVLGACASSNRDFWQTDMDVTTGASSQFQQIAATAGATELYLSASGSGGAGSTLDLSSQAEAATQVWTDLAPGQSKPTVTPDGSLSLRPLSDESLCLTVPGGNYAAGVQLTVTICDGAGDQDFGRQTAASSTALVAAGDDNYCVTAAGGIVAGSAIALEPCALEASQMWSTPNAWAGWAGPFIG